MQESEDTIKSDNAIITLARGSAQKLVLDRVMPSSSGILICEWVVNKIATEERAVYRIPIGFHGLLVYGPNTTIE